MMAAKEMDEGEFWLPSDFLTDDFFAGDEKFQETESDEEEPVAGLSRKMAADCSLHDEPKNLEPSVSVMATSPQSTLSGIGSWSFSSSGSPDGPSQVSSPPSTPFEKKDDEALDLLYAAAGQVEKLGLNREPAHVLLGTAQQDQHCYQMPAVPANNQYYSSQDLIRHQLQQARFYHLRRQQQLKQQQLQYYASLSRQNQQSRARNVNGVKPDLSSSAWPPLQKLQQRQQQPPLPGSGMTAVFLNGAKRQSNGTGVFLPRQVGTKNEPRKKPACSTVLLPARVVQALNLNLEDIGAYPALPGCYALDNGGEMGRRDLKRNQAAAPASPEICLPQEWTY